MRNIKRGINKMINIDKVKRDIGTEVFNAINNMNGKYAKENKKWIKLLRDYCNAHGGEEQTAVALRIAHATLSRWIADILKIQELKLKKKELRQRFYDGRKKRK
jgi:hypothetical protein